MSQATPTPDINLIHPHATPLEICDIGSGADPFAFKQHGAWHLLVQGDTNTDPLAHDGIPGYTVRTAGTIEDLRHTTPVHVTVSVQPKGLYQVWAAEVHFEKYMYVAISNGDNRTHRMHIYETANNGNGPWKYIGELKSPNDAYWAIDLTLMTLSHEGKQKNYAVWSGWEHSSNLDEPQSPDIVPQNIYIAEFISPTEIGPRHLLMTPVGEWCTSRARILEGPQSFYLDGQFYGLVVTGNASWTGNYATKILKYVEGDPLSSSSWSLHPVPLFEDGHGIGHGMIIQENENIYYVGHRKTLPEDGWADRMVFYTKLDRGEFEKYLKGERAPFGINVVHSGEQGV